MAYVDGNLMQALGAKIKSSNKVRAAVFASLSSGGDETSEADKLWIMNYSLERDINMCGCWFVKYLNTMQDNIVGESKVAAQPIRAHVANQHAHSTGQMPT